MNLTNRSQLLIAQCLASSTLVTMAFCGLATSFTTQLNAIAFWSVAPFCYSDDLHRSYTGYVMTRGVRPTTISTMAVLVRALAAVIPFGIAISTQSNVVWLLAAASCLVVAHASLAVFINRTLGRPLAAFVVILVLFLLSDPLIPTPSTIGATDKRLHWAGFIMLLSSCFFLLDQHRVRSSTTLSN